MFPLRFRAPGHALPLADLLARTFAGLRPHMIEAALRAGDVRVDGQLAHEGRARVAPGVRVDLRLAAFPAEDDVPFIGAEGGAAEVAAGVALLALVPAPAVDAGVLIDSGTPGVATPFRVTARRGEAACVRVDAASDDPQQTRRALAAAGMPILGDARNGGILLSGGLRLWRCASDAAKPPDEAWPLEALHAPDATSDPDAALEVSHATLRALSRGHPLVLTDTETGDAGRFAPGALVGLRGAEEAVRGRKKSVARAGKPAPARSAAAPPKPRVLVRIEGTGVVAARVWARNVSRAEEAAGIDARVSRALVRRESLLLAGGGEPDTDAFRLIHGEADELPGLFVDRLGPCLRVTVAGRAAEPLVSRVVDVLLARIGKQLGSDPPVVRVVNLRERASLRSGGASLLRGAFDRDAFDEQGRIVVRERGLRFLVDPGLVDTERPRPSGGQGPGAGRGPTVGHGIGFFLDQRDDRARVARMARGGRWLNLFAHTGAFSVALLAAGAARVTSVDLSASYLRWLEANLALNALGGTHHLAVRGDGRRYLETLGANERFHGIVLDPPTAAAAGHRFWSVRRDLAPLVAASLSRLLPGGILLVTRNDRSARGRLPAEIESAATTAGVALASVVPARAGADFPSLEGYPEGDPFEGVFARVGQPGERRSERNAGSAPPKARGRGQGPAAPRRGARQPGRRR